MKMYYTYMLYNKILHHFPHIDITWAYVKAKRAKNSIFCATNLVPISTYACGILMAVEIIIPHHEFKALLLKGSALVHLSAPGICLDAFLSSIE